MLRSGKWARSDSELMNIHVGSRDPSVTKGKIIRKPNAMTIVSLDELTPSTPEAEAGSIWRKRGCEIVVPYRTSLLLILLKYSVPQNVTWMLSN